MSEYPEIDFLRPIHPEESVERLFFRLEYRKRHLELRKTRERRYRILYAFLRKFALLSGGAVAVLLTYLVTR